MTRREFIPWLRQIHGWIGLWGATLGLLFGFTGVLLNHRAVLKIPAAQVQDSHFQIALTPPFPADMKALFAHLKTELAQTVDATRTKAEPARDVIWNNQSLRQPERWQGQFSTPHTTLQVEYWVGDQTVSVKRSENNFFATLSNFHKGTGLSVGWILLVDTLASSIMLLSITGLILWTQGRRRRIVGLMIFSTPIVIGAVIAISSW